MEMLAQLNASARLLALAGLRSQYPQASAAELQRRLAGLILGEELAYKVYGEIGDANEPVDVTLKETGVLEKLGVPYLVTAAYRRCRLCLD